VVHLTSNMLKYRHLPISNSYALEGPGQVGIEDSDSLLYMFTQGRPADIQTPTQWNLTGCSGTTLPPMLSPSSILPSPSTHSAFTPWSKNLACISTMFLFKFLSFYKTA